jgi:hypothetical protein
MASPRLFSASETKLMVNYNLYRKEGDGTTNQEISVQFQPAFRKGRPIGARPVCGRSRYGLISPID